MGRHGQCLIEIGQITARVSGVFELRLVLLLLMPVVGVPVFVIVIDHRHVCTRVVGAAVNTITITATSDGANVTTTAVWGGWRRRGEGKHRGQFIHRSVPNLHHLVLHVHVHAGRIASLGTPLIILEVKVVIMVPHLCKPIECACTLADPPATAAFSIPLLLALAFAFAFAFDFKFDFKFDFPFPLDRVPVFVFSFQSFLGVKFPPSPCIPWLQLLLALPLLLLGCLFFLSPFPSLSLLLRVYEQCADPSSSSPPLMSIPGTPGGSYVMFVWLALVSTIFLRKRRAM